MLLTIRNSYKMLTNSTSNAKLWPQYIRIIPHSEYRLASFHSLNKPIHRHGQSALR